MNHGSAARLLVLLSALGGGCSTPHSFRLQDLTELAIGESRRSEVEEALGIPSATLESVAVYESLGSEVSPPAPLSFITWPVYFGRTSERFVFLARYDAEGRLAEASLTLDGFQSMFLLLIVNPHGPLNFQGDEHRGVLAAIESRGIPVWVREGYENTLVRYAPVDAADGGD